MRQRAQEKNPRQRALGRASRGPESDNHRNRDVRKVDRVERKIHTVDGHIDQHELDPTNTTHSKQAQHTKTTTTKLKTKSAHRRHLQILTHTYDTLKSLTEKETTTGAVSLPQTAVPKAGGARQVTAEALMHVAGVCSARPVSGAVKRQAAVSEATKPRPPTTSAVPPPELPRDGTARLSSTSGT